MNRSKGERGSASIEVAMGVPAIALFLALVILGGRLALAQQAVQAAAADAARTASMGLLHVLVTGWVRRPGGPVWS